MMSLLVLSFFAEPVAFAAIHMGIPQSQASHFCQILINDGQSIMPLRAHAKMLIEPSDSISSEQLFVEFLLSDNNWTSLRIFPHVQDNGTVEWYAPTDKLPESLGYEHIKYIREVFPRLLAEVQANNWSVVDSYIDRIVEYQCEFGGCRLDKLPSSDNAILLVLLIPALFFLFKTKVYSIIINN